VVLSGYAVKSIRRKRRLIRLAIVAIGLAAYVGSYAVMSAAGDYQASQSGRLRYVTGPAVTDVYHWQPAMAYWQPFRDIRGNDTSHGNLLGYVYSPLIRLDRKWRHPSVYIFDEPATTGPSGG
jgi:hypothetical protein